MPSAMSVQPRAVALAWGALGLLLTAFAMADIATLGFPDGHLTAYEMETLPVRRALAALCLVQALAIPALVLTRRLRMAGFLAAVASATLLVVLPLLIVPTCPVSDTCQRGFEVLTGRPMDHGVGG